MSSPSFQKARDLLKKLHDLIAMGADESDEGDAIRDEMDLAWRNLAPDEIRRIEGLSADLYSLSGDEIKDPKFAHVSAHEVEQRLIEAYKAHRFDETLELLRYPGATYSVEMTAFVRARCWEGQGDLTIALWFFELAERRAAKASRYGAFVLETLSKLGLAEVRRERAERYLQDPDTLPDIVFMAMHAVYAPDAPRSVLQSILNAGFRGLNKALELPPAERNPHLGLVAAALTAACRELLGQAATIRDAYRPIVESYDALDFVWTAYGLDLARHDRDEATRAFDRAIDMRTSLFFPYVWRATWAIEAGEPLEALRICEAAPPNLKDRDLAHILELYAVASRLAGKKSDKVSALLHDAKTRSPLDMRLARVAEALASTAPSAASIPLPDPPGWRPSLSDPPPPDTLAA